MKRRIGILTSGGDCPGLNATIRGVAKACYEMLGTENVEIVGISEDRSATGQNTGKIFCCQHSIISVDQTLVSVHESIDL